MLRFKQFIHLLEAQASHFSHIPDFDTEQHKNLVAAYNEMGLPTNQAIQIKSLDELRTKVEPGLEKVKEKAEKKRLFDTLFKTAFSDGSVEKVYDNPESKVTIYKPHNARGCRAVQSGIISSACVFGHNNKEAQGYFDSYDPSGQHSYIFHLNNEKDPNYRRIAAIGVLPGKIPYDHAFVDKGNNNIPDDVWERLRIEHGLDQIPALNGIRGIPIDKDYRSNELINNLTKGNFGSKEINNAKEHGYWDENVHQPLLDARLNYLRNNLLDDIKKGKHTYNDIALAKNFKILNEDHKKALANIFADKIRSGKNDDLDTLNAQKHGYLNDVHKMLLGDQFMDKMNSGKHGLEDLVSANSFDYLMDEHRNKIQEPKVKRVFEDALLALIKKNQHNDPILDIAHEHGLIREKAKKILGDQFMDKMNSGKHGLGDLVSANSFGYLMDEHRNKIQEPKVKRVFEDELLDLIKTDQHSDDVLDIAHEHDLIGEKSKQILGGRLLDKMNSGKHDTTDLEHAKQYGYLNDEHKKILAGKLIDKLNSGKGLAQSDLHSAKYFSYLSHAKPEIVKHLTNKIEQGLHTKPDLDLAKSYGYLDDINPALGKYFVGKIRSKTHTMDDLNTALTYGVLDKIKDEHLDYIRDTPKLDELFFAKDNKYLPEHMNNKFSEALINLIKQDRHTNEDLLTAKKHGYFDAVKPELANQLSNKIKSNQFTFADLYNANLHGYLDDGHRKLLADRLIGLSTATALKDVDLDHAKQFGYLDAVKPELVKQLKSLIKVGRHSPIDLIHAKKYGYLDDIKSDLSDHINSKINAGEHNHDDLRTAFDYGFLDKIKDTHVNYLRKNLRYNELRFAQGHQYLPKELEAKIPEALSQLIEQGKHTKDNIYQAKTEGFLDDIKPALIAHVSKLIDSGLYDYEDLSNALRDGYWTDAHRKAFTNRIKQIIKNGDHSWNDIHDFQKYGYFDDIKPELIKHLANKIKNNDIDPNDLIEAQRYKYFDDVKPELINHLTNKIKNNDVDHNDLILAKRYNYFDDVKPELINHLTNKIKNNDFTYDGDVYRAYKHGYLDDVKQDLADHLTDKIKNGSHNKQDIYSAKSYGYFTPEHQELLDQIGK